MSLPMGRLKAKTLNANNSLRVHHFLDLVPTLLLDG